MGQSDRKSVFITMLLAATAAGVAATAATVWLPHWAAMTVAILVAAGLTGSLIQMRLLRPVNYLHAELRGNLLGSSLLFDAHPPIDDGAVDEPRDPMLRAVDHFKYTAEQMADQGNRIAIKSAELSFAVRHLNPDAGSENRGVHDAGTTVASIEGATNALAQSAAQAAVGAACADKAGRSGQHALSAASQRMYSANEQVKLSIDQLTALLESADRVESAVAEVNSIAEQTKLLAVNAMHDAAHAGEQGRSFAVAADEVRCLADRTAEATHEIGQMLAQAGSETRAATRNLSGLTAALGESVALISEAGQHMADVTAGTDHQQVRAVSEGATANWEELVQISNAGPYPRPHRQEAVSQIADVSAKAAQISSIAETIHSQVVTLGGQSQHAHMRFVAQSVAQSVGQAFEQGIDDALISESALFERDDTPVAGTGPLSYATPFNEFAGQVLPAVLEPVTELNPDLTYIGIVDINGESTSHSRRHGAPHGDENRSDIGDDDNRQGRCKPVDSRCGRNTEPFLLQTYQLDSGEVVHDLSAPVHVHGRHWGGFRMAYRAQSD